MCPLRQVTPTYSSHVAGKLAVRLPGDMHEQIVEVVHSHRRSMNSEIVARLKQSLLQEGVLQNNLGVRLDSPGLSLYERELLQRSRQLTHRQQNALVILIAHNAELAQA